MPAAKKTAKKKAAKKTAAKKSLAAAPVAAGRLLPPADGVVVRMYRIGHGDCFLLAFPGETATEPVYVLIDCGYKPGSPGFIPSQPTPKDVCADLRAATGGRIDLAIVTHEHQDHVNAITETNFKDVEIGQSWFAWTEDPTDDLANDLRKSYKDKLLGLVVARNRLAADGPPDMVRRIDRFLAFELGGEDEAFDGGAAVAMFGAAAKDPLTSLNKKSMKLFKDRAKKGVRFIRPHEQIHSVPGVEDVRVYAMGPPRDADLLKSMDPEEGEGFHLAAMANVGSFFAAAARAAGSSRLEEAPFAGRYCVPWDRALDPTQPDSHFNLLYGRDAGAAALPEGDEAPSGADWRRIDQEWLYSAEQLALDMNDYTNNSSLVLAFELGKGGKVLLFAADAQRGNWISWAKKGWQDGDHTVTARDLLSRVVLYKVGHHGSHNATLDGQAGDEHPNLQWMAGGEHGHEFVAMITAVRKWAETQDGWDHPLKAIKDALLKKASGRVFQTDTDFDLMAMADGGSPVDWNTFRSRTTGTRLYFDYVIQR